MTPNYNRFKVTDKLKPPMQEPPVHLIVGKDYKLELNDAFGSFELVTLVKLQKGLNCLVKDMAGKVKQAGVNNLKAF